MSPCESDTVAERGGVTRGDLVVMSMVVLAAFVLWALILPATADPPRAVLVTVIGTGQELARVDLPATRSLSFDRPAGPLVVQIDGFRARISESHCPNPAWHARWLDRGGDQAVCIPNGIVVQMIGDQAGEDYDAITR